MRLDEFIFFEIGSNDLFRKKSLILKGLVFCLWLLLVVLFIFFLVFVFLFFWLFVLFWDGLLFVVVEEFFIFLFMGVFLLFKIRLYLL